MTITQPYTVNTGTTTAGSSYYPNQSTTVYPTYPIYTDTSHDYLKDIRDLKEDVKDLNKIHDEELKELHKKIILRPKDPIKNVWFNQIKGTVMVEWTDGEKTLIHCHEEDEFDLEKAIAICFMKKAYDNRGCFNEFLRKWLDKAIDQNKKKERAAAPISKEIKTKEKFKTHMKKRSKKEKK